MLRFKVRPEVAEGLGLTRERAQFPDGNWMLLPTDFERLEPEWRLDPYGAAARQGAVCLEAYEARDEQRGLVVHPLPEAGDNGAQAPLAGDGGEELLSGDGSEEALAVAEEEPEEV